MVGVSHFVIFSTLCVAMVLARPTEIDDLFAGYLKNVNLYNSEKQSHIVKRRIYEDNQDFGTKKVSLKSLIGDLEQNFIQTASSAGYMQSQSTEHTETNPFSTENHSILKRKTETMKPVDSNPPHEEKNINLENMKTESIETTTERISTKAVGTTHIQISHITVEPLNGDLPVVPAFDVNHIKPLPSKFKDDNSNATAHTTPTTTSMQAVASEENTEKPNEHVEEMKENDTKDVNKDHTEASHDSNSHATEKPEVLTIPTTTTTAAKKSADDLKESEAELKEKVAEIEAEPVILSARV